MGALLWFAGFLVCVVAAAARVARRQGCRASAADTLLRAVLASAAIIVGSMMAAGAAGALRPVTVLLLEGAIAACVFAAPMPARGPRRGVPLHAFPVAVVAMCATFVSFAIAYAVWHAPLTLYDSLSYHLHFAARWVQDGAIAIIPTPFSDEAQAYAPGNGELVLAWLMLPFHSDVLARMGQLPFALAGAVALYAIARRVGARQSHACYPAGFFLLSRPIAEQMIGANVDLICAACFLLAVYFVLVAVDTDARADWIFAGIAAGLYAGTKYLALVYLPVLLLLACARGPRRRALWTLAGLAAFAAPWYLRNWIVAGSPIYPATFALGGVTVARGAFTRAAMLNTVFHTSDVRLLPAMMAHGIGPTLFVVWLPCAIAGSIAMVRRGWWPTGGVALAPLLMLPLYWFGFPVNVDSRFLMPAVGLALVPLAFAFARQRVWNAAMHGFYAAAMAWIVVGASGSLPGRLPWFMAGWLALHGLVRPPFVAAFFGVGGAMATVWLIARRSGRLAPFALATAAVCATATLAFGAPRWCGSEPCRYLDATPTFIRSGYIDSWRWVAAHITDSAVAYTGTNLPYPLTGERLTNRVVYVNIDGRARWRFHDYDRGYRSGRFMPEPPLLAASSGELLPVAGRAGPRDDAVRPRYERMHGNREGWIFALETLRVRYLFVAMLSAYEIDYVWHNDRGFPIEDEWALADPVRFHLVYTNPQVHIYAFAPEVRVHG